MLNSAGNSNRTSGEYICHSPDKYLTLSCNTHTRRETCLSDTAATVLTCPAGCPLALLSSEKWFRADKRGLNQSPGTLQGHERQRYSECLIHTAFSYRFSSLNFPTMHLPSRRGRRYLHAKAHHALCECWLWLVMFRTHKKTSLGRSTRQKEKGGGWLFCILGGLPPLVGKLNIYILQLELLFFSLYFPEHRLHTSLLRGMLLRDSNGVHLFVGHQAETPGTTTW